MRYISQQNINKGNNQRLLWRTPQVQASFIACVEGTTPTHPFSSFPLTTSYHPGLLV